MSQQVGANKMVSIAYTIRDRSGHIVEYSGFPVSYVHGDNDSPLFPQIASALEGLSTGETAEVFLTAKQAFGPHDPGLTFSDDIDNAPEELRYVGAELDAENERGEPMHFRVVRVEGDQITVDSERPAVVGILTKICHSHHPGSLPRLAISLKILKTINKQNQPYQNGNR